MQKHTRVYRIKAFAYGALSLALTHIVPHMCEKVFKPHALILGVEKFRIIVGLLKTSVTY